MEWRNQIGSMFTLCYNMATNKRLNQSVLQTVPDRLQPSGIDAMRRLSVSLALISVLAASGCAVAPPTGPSVMALPPAGKDFAAFQQDDFTCRGFATQQTGGANPSQAATTSGVG